MASSAPGQRRRASTLALLVVAMAAGACASRSRRPPARPPSPGPIAFVATAYCTGRITATGTRVREGIVAADPAVLPFGTVIRVEGLPARYNREYTVLDTGRDMRGRRIDLYIADCREAKRFGRASASVVIVRRSAASPR